MPIFEFACPICREDFEELVRSSAEAESVVCPHCGHVGATRKLSVFAARGAGREAPARLSGGACGRCGDPEGPCGS